MRPWLTPICTSVGSVITAASARQACALHDALDAQLADWTQFDCGPLPGLLAGGRPVADAAARAASIAPSLWSAP